MRLRLIGVGTRHGDDAAGLLVADRLARGPLPPGAAVLHCERPALDLVDALAHADAALVIDAMRSGRRPGSIASLRPSDLGPTGPVSSHGLGVAEAVALARSLGRAPARLAIIGIEVGPIPHIPACRLSPAVRRGVARAAELARSLLGELSD